MTPTFEWRIYWGLLTGAVLFLSAPAIAQTPRQAPAPGFVLHDQRAVGRFVVERWVSEASPEVSPAGFCECMTVVYEGDRLVLNLGLDAGLTEVDTSARDITGDGRPELVISWNSGGAHCCSSTTIYSVEATVRTLLSVSTGNCMGRLVDVDGRGVEEFETCDDRFAYEFCSFAFSPLPTVVFAYDAATGMFELATPTFAEYYEDQRLRELVDARQAMADYRDDDEIVRCAALRPALSLVYSGQAEEGLALLRQLYERPDGLTLWRQVMDLAAQSPLWIPR
jgi:hypothetical protein